MKKLLWLLFIPMGVVNAQENIQCLSTQPNQQYFSTHPEDQKDLDRLNKLSQKGMQLDKSIKTIPVVFHVNDPSNPQKVTLAQAQSAIDILNEDYSAMNPDFSSLRPEFSPIAANVGVQFCLAIKDPSGNLTTGITYHYNSFNGKEPDGYGTSVKSISAWPCNKYLNIWVVNYPEDDGDAYRSGWAFLPSTSLANSGLDGIVMNHRYLGYANGITSSSEVSGPSSWQAHMARVLTHEVGHYLNLHHTFYNYCNSPGDYVNDTPPIYYFGSNNCQQLGTMCIGVTMVNDENYMDYTSCPSMFTDGQKTRMLTTLSSSVAYRNNLWTTGNLNAAGCGATSISELHEFIGELDIFPNPFTNLITVNYHMLEPGNYEIALYNSIGAKTNYSKSEVFGETGSTIIDLDKIPTGIYFLEFISELGKTKRIKVIKL